MYVFHNGVRILERNIEVAEVPERMDSQAIQLIGNRLHMFLRHTENRHQRMMLLVEFVNGGIIQYGVAADLSADDFTGIIENAN